MSDETRAGAVLSGTSQATQPPAAFGGTTAPVAASPAATSPKTQQSAVLDSAHIGDIEGAFGTIKLDDDTPQRSLSWKVKTLLAIVGPGLIVMVGDNDAGAFGTYTNAGQNYGTDLLWTLLLLIPVLYVNQEMVLRLGAVAGVGHARLIFERFGRFWGAFSVVDLFLLNALTIVTEFIGISLGLRYLGIPQIPGIIVAALVIIGAVSTGSFKRFERVCLILVGFSLLLIPIVIMVHPPLADVVHGFFVPTMPGGSGQLSTVMLLIIGIVGTTVAPWQLFFQQSYVIDKRITPRFMGYERVDLWVGIVIVVVGAAAMMSFTAATFAGTPEQGFFSDALGVARGLGTYVGPVAAILFALALIDASIIGAAAVGLSTTYALSDTLGIKHSLHRKPKDAKGFYAVFAGLLVVAAVIVMIPGSPLGLLTVGVQTLAGVLLPSATVFLLLLCNDKEVLGPWVNGRAINIFTSIVIGLLVLLSVILTVAVLFPGVSGATMLWILGLGGGAGALAGIAIAIVGHVRGGPSAPIDRSGRETWRMPPIALLKRPELSVGRRLGLSVLRIYLVVAVVLAVVRVVQIAVGH